MGNQVYNNIGKQIKNSLAESLKTGDFTGLSDVIAESAEAAIKEAGKSVTMEFKGSTPFHEYVTKNYSEGDATREMQERLNREHARQREEMARRELERNKIRADRMARRQAERNRRGNAARQAYDSKGSYKPNEIVVKGFKPIDETKSDVFRIMGGIGSIFSMAALLVRGVSAIFGGATIGGWVINLVALFAFTSMYIQGNCHKKLLSTARRFAQICGEHMYASISQIASSTGISEKKVVKEIRKMLQKGIFPSGYLDDKGTTLMLSDSVYNEYLKSTRVVTESDEAGKQEQLSKDAKDAISKAKKTEAYKKLPKESQAELDSMMAEGNSSIERLRKLNSQIPGEAISKKLSRLEELLEEIFDRITEHPEQMNRIHKLMDYYLPTMLKLVEAYREYDSVSEPGEDIVKAKNEIELTLDSINQAFVQLLNNLFSDSVLDVTTDAMVLKSMLAREGLSDDTM